jgi:hypothetical protein
MCQQVTERYNIEWRKGSTHYLSPQWMKMSDKLHAPAALPSGPKPTEQ